MASTCFLNKKNIHMHIKAFIIRDDIIMLSCEGEGKGSLSVHPVSPPSICPHNTSSKGHLILLNIN